MISCPENKVLKLVPVREREKVWRLGAGSWREISGEVNPSGKSQAQGLMTRVLFPSSIIN